MRLYTFINFYLSSIQAGIQSAHIVSELFAHEFTPDQAFSIKDWACNHKTIITCNGGNNKSLDELVEFFSSFENQYPFIEFYEDEESLGGIRTGVGIVLPPEIYDVEVKFENKFGFRKKYFVFDNGEIHIEYNDPDSYIYQLIDRIKSAPLAR